MQAPRVRSVGGVALAVGAVALAATPAFGTKPGGPHGQKHTAGTIDIIATGLHNPRHLVIGPRNAILVAEAGQGSTDPLCHQFPGPEVGTICIGDTGSIARIDRNGTLKRVVTGLPSAGDGPPAPGGLPQGSNAIGPSSVTVDGEHRIAVTIGGGEKALADAAALVVPPVDVSGFGKLQRFDLRKNTSKQLADFYAFELANNPDAAIGEPTVDTDVTDVAKYRGGYFVSDAAQNSVVWVKKGKIKVVHLFGNHTVTGPGNAQVPMQAVPTAVIRVDGSHHGKGAGTLYVSQLTGFPFPVGGASIFRVNPRTGNSSVLASGFTNVMDIARGRHGELWVLEIATNGLLSGDPHGAIWRIDRKGVKTRLTLPATTQLITPGGIAYDAKRDALLVSNNGTSPTDGQVLRIWLGKR